MTNNAKPNFIKGTLSLVSASSFTTLIGLISTVLITHYFSVETFGYYALVLVVVSFLGTLSSMGLDYTISKFIAGANDEAIKRTYINTTITIRIFALLLVCIISWIGKPALVLLFGLSLPSETLLFSILLLLILESLRSLLRSILRGFFLFHEMGISDIIVWTLNLLFLVALIYLKKLGIIELVVVRSLASLIACIYSFISIPLSGKISFQFKQIKVLLKFGYPLQINDIFTFIFTRADTILIAFLLGPTYLAVYEVARRIPDNLRSIYEPFQSVYYPSLSKQFENEEFNNASSLLNNSLRFISFVTILGAIIVLLFGVDIIRLLFSVKYVISAPIFTILMIALSVSLVSNIMGTSLVAVGDSDKPMKINLVHITVKLIGTLVFLPVFGILGAAVVCVLAETVTLPFNLFFLRKRLSVKNLSFLNSFMIFSVFAPIVYILKPATLLAKASCLIIFFLPCILLSVITNNDLKRILENTGITSLRIYQRLFIRTQKNEDISN